MRERSPSPLRGPLLRAGALGRLGTWGSQPPALPAHRPARPAPQMPAIAVLAAAAAAWCFLQVESRHLDALAGGAGPNHGNFLDNDQWLSTVSQYDRDKYWNRFRDVSTCATRPWGARSLSVGTPERGLGCVCVWGGAGGHLPWGLVGPCFLGTVLPERNFKENFEGSMRLPVTCGPGVCICRAAGSDCTKILHRSPAAVEKEVL